MHRPGTLDVVPDALSHSVPELSALESFTNIRDPWYHNLRCRILTVPDEFSHLRVERNLLFFAPSANNLPSNLSPRNLIVSRKFQKQILARCHDSLTTAHFGITTTLACGK